MVNLKKDFNLIYTCRGCSGTGRVEGGRESCEVCNSAGKIGIDKKNGKRVTSVNR